MERPTESPPVRPRAMKVIYFRSPAHFRRWLEQHHASAAEVWVGFYLKAAKRGGLTYAEALDEALCCGWIDGLRRKHTPDSYTSRFSPRKPRSIWSLTNVRHAERLLAAGRMRAAGLKAFAARDPKRTGIYSFEQRPADLPARLKRIFRASPAAWSQWKQLPPGYRRTATWWVMSAVREETRARRLAKLIADTSRGQRLAILS